MPELKPLCASPHSPCRHPRVQTIAKDSESEYLECLDCGEILDKAEFPEAGAKPGNFDESLSDA